MPVQQLNFYRGQTITLKWRGKDSTFIFADDGEHPFKLLIYPKGMDMSLDANKSKLRQIDSRDVKTGNSDPVPVYGDGFVYYSEEEENTVYCVLPWSSTVDMDETTYTVELLYGRDTRYVVTRNNDFILVSSVSEQVNADYDKIETT